MGASENKLISGTVYQMSGRYAPTGRASRSNNSRMPIIICDDRLHDRVLPFYEQLGAPVGAILTDNGREFCGIPEKHPYELLIAMEGIEHRKTRIRSSRPNNFFGRR